MALAGPPPGVLIPETARMVATALQQKFQIKSMTHLQQAPAQAARAAISAPKSHFE